MTGYPWATGDALLAADLNAAIANAGGGTGTAFVLVSDVPPTGVPDNTLWYDSAGTGLYILYNDGNSTQWVIAESQNTLTDAPVDGNTYGRTNAAWVMIMDGTGLATSVGVQVGGASGPTWTTGSAAPSSAQPIGSLYSRIGGALGATLYVSRGGGTWVAVSGV